MSPDPSSDQPPAPVDQKIRQRLEQQVQALLAPVRPQTTTAKRAVARRQVEFGFAARRLFFALPLAALVGRRDCNGSVAGSQVLSSSVPLRMPTQIRIAALAYYAVEAHAERLGRISSRGIGRAHSRQRMSQ